ncbi:MAG: ATP-binding cassette domain-containing protein [Proteobacteria bacterium]|nr:ATP-binding cassette domain-containing protein [Pseudomonadota bacterium]
MLECKELCYLTKTWRASFSFTASAGQWLGVAGPSGGGKSTLLKLLAGFIQPTSGDILRGSRELLNQSLVGLAPSLRGFSMMFQQSSLLPHLTCQQNLDLVLTRVSEAAHKRRERITAALEVACLSSVFLTRKPGQLSGGEQARMNLARTLLLQAEWLLLDEPFAAIDQDLRMKILSHLEAWRQRRGVGIVLVSHDPADALLMADKLLYIEGGEVLAEGDPQELAKKPRNASMGRLLKRGTVFREGEESFYGLPEDFYTDLAEAQNATAGEVLTIKIQSYKIVFTGAAQYVVDLSRGMTWMLPQGVIFKGFLFVSKESLHRLGDL